MGDRTLLVGGIAAALLGVLLMWGAPGPGGGWFDGHHGSWPGAPGGDEAVTELPGAPRLEVRATEFTFQPDRMEIDELQAVNVVLDNRGRVFHDLVVVGTDFRVWADAGVRGTGVLLPLPAGVYRVECTVPGHAAAGMVATLLVGG